MHGTSIGQCHRKETQHKTIFSLSYNYMGLWVYTSVKFISECGALLELSKLCFLQSLPAQ